MRWLLGILVVICVVLASWYFWSAGVVNAPQQTSTATTTASSEIIPGTPDQTYTNQHLSFSIRYPSTATATSSFSAGFLPLTQAPIVAFELPQSLFSGTNLVEAGVYIGATTTPHVMTACTDLSQVVGPVSTSTANIGGQQFVEVDSTDAGAGNLYQEKTFRTFQNGWCLEIVELLHSGNIGNYTPGTVQPFDQAKFTGILEAIVSTYYPIPTGQ